MQVADIAKYHLILDLGVSNFVFACYKPVWEAFSEDVQKYFKSQSGAFFSYQIAKSLHEEEKVMYQQLLNAGQNFFELSKEDQKILDELFISSQKKWLNSMSEEKKAIAKEVLEYALERSAFYKKEYYNATDY